MSDEHEIYIGDKIERALEIIGEENDRPMLVSQYADHEIEPDVELRGNYLHVEVEEPQ